MSSHVGKRVVFYRIAVVKLAEFLLAMASSIVIKHYTFVMIECR
jgi:hypothetical protein